MVRPSRFKCGCVLLCVSEVEDKWPNSLITSAAPEGVLTAGDERGTEESWSLVSWPFLFFSRPLPPILYVSSQIDRLLSQWQRKWIGGSLWPL